MPVGWLIGLPLWVLVGLVAGTWLEHRLQIVDRALGTLTADSERPATDDNPAGSTPGADHATSTGSGRKPGEGRGGTTGDGYSPASADGNATTLTAQDRLAEISDAMAAAVKRAIRSVVSISVVGGDAAVAGAAPWFDRFPADPAPAGNHSGDPTDDRTADDDAATSSERRPASSGPFQPREEFGSGIVYASTDLEVFIVTNEHVAGRGGRITVSWADVSVVARLVGADVGTDLAVVAVLRRDLLRTPIAAELADSDAVEPGQLVFAIGQPSGYRNTATDGIISATTRAPRLDPIGGVDRFAHYLQTSAPINRGNSGGPLVDVRGQVVGINSWKVRKTEGLGFAVPSNLVQRVADDLIEFGRVRWPSLGIRVEPFLEPERAQFGHGIWIVSVTQGSPAERYGLEPNDIIRQIDDRRILSVGDMRMSLAYRRPGDRQAFLILRRGDEMIVPILLGTAADPG